MCRPQEVYVVVVGGVEYWPILCILQSLWGQMPNRLSNAWSLKKLGPLLASRSWVRYAWEHSLGSSAMRYLRMENLKVR